MFANDEKIEVTCIGDSTIDNKIWVDGLISSYIKSRFGIVRDDSATLVNKFNTSFFKPALSVVENLMAIMPNCIIHDHTNDGFTTTDVLSGNLRDKVFPVGAFTSFPHTNFKPLVEGEQDIKRSKFIILSIGGNNFREFLEEAHKLTGNARKLFVKNTVNGVFAGITKEYVEIVQAIRNLNANATILLMTQYYPSFSQKDYKIYEFMHEIGELLDIGGPSHDPAVVIHSMVKRTYTDAFAKIAELQLKNIVVADVTSTLNPYDEANHVSQIEPSNLGGKKIAMMLKYIMTSPEIVSGNAYRFLPQFFNSTQKNSKNDVVISTPIERWSPLHPLALKESNINVQVTENDLSLLIRLSNLSRQDSTKFSTSIFKLFNNSDRFSLLLQKIKNVTSCFSENRPKKEKAISLVECIQFIKNKGFLSIYTMETPGYQTPYQSALDRLEKLLDVMPEDDQADFLKKIYSLYTEHQQKSESLSNETAKQVLKS